MVFAVALVGGLASIGAVATRWSGGILMWLLFGVAAVSGLVVVAIFVRWLRRMLHRHATQIKALAAGQLRQHAEQRPPSQSGTWPLRD